MAAKPRVTVRLAPETLHQLAYVAARDAVPPAELARMLLQAQLAAVLGARGLGAECKEHWRAWLAEQARAGNRPESPTQEDYDELAVGLPGSLGMTVPAALNRPLAVTIAADAAAIKRSLARLTGGKGRG